jgi:hypothetical protein
MKRLPALLITAAALFSLLVSAQTNPPITRTVSGQVLTSKDTPAVRLEFDKAFKYIGAQSFVLYDVANAEQHFFVDADKDGRLKRFFWVQFEGYLPTNTHSYNYKSPKIVNAGGFDFFADAYPRSLKGDLGRPLRRQSRPRVPFEQGFSDDRHGIHLSTPGPHGRSSEA